LTPKEQTQAAAVAGGGPPVSKKRTLVENLMLLSGGGVVGGLLALTWRLVRGFAITEPFTKALGVFVLACMLLVVALTTLGQNKPTPAAA